MSDPKYKRVFWISLAILVPIYLLIKYLSPQFVHYLYHTENIGILNSITGAQISQVLDFYVGRMNDLIFMPMMSVISGILFLLFYFAYLRGASALKFFFAVFIFLLITKWEVLFFPPYGETVAGPFSEALWLYHNSFDYVGLFHQESFTFGGPKVYLFSIYPTYLAMLLKIIPSTKAFIFVNHFIVFAMAAAVITLFRSILLKVYNEEKASLISLFLLFLPLYQSMTEAINMEMPCLFFVMFSARYLIDKKIFSASMMAIMATLVKGPGGLACAVVFLVGILLVLFDDELKGKYKILIVPTVALALGLTKVILLRKFINPGTIQPPAGTISFFIGWEILANYSKHLIISYGVVLAVFTVIIIREWIRKKDFKALFRQHYIPIVSYLLAGMWFGVYLNVSTMGPRYQLLLLPFLIFCIVHIFTYFIKFEKVTVRILIFLIVLSNVCAFGLFHKEKVESSMWSYNDYERSLEYRNDLKLHMNLAREIETYYSDYTIGAPFVVAQKLGFPELGYVTKKMDVMIYGMGLTYMRTFASLKELDILKTIWTGFYKSDLPDDLVYPIDPEDRFVRDIVMGDKRIALFQGGVAIERARIIFEMYRRGFLHFIAAQKKQANL